VAVASDHFTSGSCMVIWIWDYTLVQDCRVDAIKWTLLPFILMQRPIGAHPG
jgi:hypothetical protein